MANIFIFYSTFLLKKVVHKHRQLCVVSCNSTFKT